MAAQVRYQTEFKSSTGRQFRVQIWDLDINPLGWGFSGYKPLTIASDGLEVQYGGDASLHLDPIIPSVCKVDLIIENADQEKLLTNIAASNELQFAISIETYESGAYTPYWRGVLSPETVSADYGLTPRGVSLSFSDGLALLKDVPYRVSEQIPYTGFEKMRKHIGRCLSKLPHMVLWGEQDDFFVSMSDMYHSDQIGSPGANTDYADDPLFYSGCNSAVFYQPASRPNPYGRNFLKEGAFYSCYQVIESIMIAMGLRMSHAHGRFFCVSPMVYLDALGYDYLRYGKKSDKRSLTDPSFQDSVSQNLDGNDAVKLVNPSTLTYDVAAGSSETWLPAVASASYIHNDADAKSVFRDCSTTFLKLDTFSASLSQLTGPRLPLGFSSGQIDTQEIPSGGLINANATVPEDTGVRIKGKPKVRLRNPRNGAANDVGTAAKDVRVAEQWLGCKIVAVFTIKVGTYYLHQAITQKPAGDFTDEATFGVVTLNASAPGVAGGSDRQYYPLEAGEASWQNSAGTFEFDCNNFELTTPTIQGIEYDDDVGEVTSYPVGCWTRRREHNNLRYDNESYNTWTANQPAGMVINDDWSGVSFTYPNPYLTIDIDLQTPPLPNGVGEQTGITFDVSMKAFTAEGDLLPDADPSSVSTGANWLGNVIAGACYIEGFRFFIGNGEEDVDTIYRTTEASPNGYEHINMGQSVLGSRYRGAHGEIGYLTHSNLANNVTNPYSLGWRLVSEGTSVATRGNYEELAKSAYNFRSKNRELYDLLLLSNSASSQMVAPYQSLVFEYDNPTKTLLVLSSRINIHRDEVQVSGVVLDTEDRTVVEVNNTEGRGTPATGGIPPVVLGGKMMATSTGGVAPADVAKLGLISVSNAVNLDTLASNIAANQGTISTNTGNISSTSSEVSDINELLKTAAENKKGVFSNVNSASDASVEVTNTNQATLRAGGNTQIDMTQNSPGTITLSVQSGPSGSEQQMDALTIAGNTTLLDTVMTTAVKAEFNRQVSFTNTATFNGATPISGVEVGDLDGVTITSPSTGQVLQWNGTTWVNAAGGGGGGAGTVTSVGITAGSSLEVTSGSPVTTSGSITVGVGQGGIDTDQIASSSVTTVKLENGAVTTAKIADDAITTDKILDEQVTMDKLALNAVGTEQLSDTAVTSGSYTNVDITVDAQGRITAAANGSVAFSELTGKPTTVSGYGITDAFDGAYSSLTGSPTTITTSQADAIVANTAKTGITAGQASAITANTAKVGITTQQASDITANNAKTGITSGQANAITANTAKIATVVDDTTPQLGGPLDVNGEIITSASNGDVVIEPDGTGAVYLKTDDFQVQNASGTAMMKITQGTPNVIELIGDTRFESGITAAGSIKLEELNLAGQNFIKLQAPMVVTNDVTLTLPDGAGTNGQVLQTNGSGTLSWTDRVAKVNPVVQNVLQIERVAAGQTPKVYLKGEDNLGGVFLKVPDDTTDVTLTLPNTTGTNGQVLQTNGSGVMTWEDASGGGSTGPIPLAKISGRWMWSSADDGERVMTGNTSYGPFNFYSHTSEPNNTTIRVYSSSHTVNQTSGSMPAYYMTAFGVSLGVDTKKVRIDFNFRVQNAPSGSTWGLSMWGANAPANGTTANQTYTLRAVSSDVTTTTTSSTAFYSGTVTTSGVIANDYILPMFENRSGSLTTTTYLYGQLNIYLVD
jgi:hypothetical protein